MLEKIHQSIIDDPFNQDYTEKKIMPLYVAHPKAKILLIGQAPGIKAQEANLAFKDASGETLIQWLNISEEEFRNPENFAILPMDFYYPGKGKSGDKPPRKGFAKKFHPPLIKAMPKIKMIILIGQYAQKYYLKDAFKENLTETVKAYKEFYPIYFPIVHPSPLNFRWLNKNPWFLKEVIPVLQQEVSRILG